MKITLSKWLFKRLSIFYCFLPSMFIKADNINKLYWKYVLAVSVNSEYLRTLFMSFDNRNDVISGHFEGRQYDHLLSSTWNFYYVDFSRKLPANLTASIISTDICHDIQVPGNWVVQGHVIPLCVNHNCELNAYKP